MVLGLGSNFHTTRHIPRLDKLYSRSALDGFGVLYSKSGLGDKIEEIWYNVTRFGVLRVFREYYWKLNHRYNPKHQYHIIKLDVEPGYMDPDIRIELAIFKEVSDFYVGTKELINWDDKPHVLEILERAHNFYQKNKDSYDNLKDEKEKIKTELLKQIIDIRHHLWYP